MGRMCLNGSCRPTRIMYYMDRDDLYCILRKSKLKKVMHSLWSPTSLRGRSRGTPASPGNAKLEVGGNALLVGCVFSSASEFLNFEKIKADEYRLSDSTVSLEFIDLMTWEDCRFYRVLAVHHPLCFRIIIVISARSPIKMSTCALNIKSIDI